MSELLRKPMWPESGPIVAQTRQFPDEYGEALVARSFATLAAEAWGLTRCDLDLHALASGVLRLTDASGRFASGTPLVLKREALSRSLPTDRSAVLASIGLARLAVDAPNVTEVVDETAAVRHLRVRRGPDTALHPRLRILFDDEGGGAYERLPIARVSLAGKHPAIDAEFVPPTLRFWPGSPIAKGLADVVRALLVRRKGLLAARETRALDLRTLAPASVAPLLLLSILNESLALLVHQERSRALSPRELHSALAALLGSLEALDGRAQTTDVPYVHTGAGPGFRSIVERVLAILPMVARDAHAVFPLTRENDGRFSLAIHDPETLARRVYLVAGGADEDTLTTLLSAYAKVASPERLPLIVNSATRGVPVALDFDPPPPLPSSARTCAFRVDTRSPYWTEILVSRSLVVFVPQTPRDLSLSLYVLSQESQ